MEQQVYLDGFSCWNDSTEHTWDSVSVLGQFQEPKFDEPDFVYASYTQECYEGSAFVAYFTLGKWYVVTASHCSCYGLEGQFTPEEFDPKLYIQSRAEGKSTLSTWGLGGDTNVEMFDEWLAWATSHT